MQLSVARKKVFKFITNKMVIPIKSSIKITILFLYKYILQMILTYWQKSRTIKKLREMPKKCGSLSFYLIKWRSSKNNLIFLICKIKIF